MKSTIDKYIGKGNQNVCEDFMFAKYIRDDSLLCIIADGMGELDHAASASKIVVEEISDFILKKISNVEIPVESILPGAIEQANERIFKERQQLFCKMGAAVAILLCHNNKAYISWLGDVRVYLVRNRCLYLLTTDHTIQNLIKITVLNPVKYAHILTRCVKGSDLEEIPLITREIVSGDRFILCSDGFYNNINDKKMSLSLMRSVIGDITGPEDDYSVIEVSF